MVVLLEGSPISTEELWSSVRVTVMILATSLTKALLPRFLSLAGQPALGTVLVVPNFFHLKYWRLRCSWGPSKLPTLLVPFPRSVPRHTLVSELYREFLRPYGLVFCSDMHCQLWDLICAFPNIFQSIEFITGGLQSCYRNFSRMINGNRMHVSSISSLVAKGTYVNQVFMFFKCVNTFKNLFSLCHYGVLCVDC